LPNITSRSTSRLQLSPERLDRGIDRATPIVLVEVFSPTIGRQLLELELIDEIDLHIAPILLGQGIRLYDDPGSEPIRLHRVGEGDPAAALNARYRPTTTATSAS
jgi:hypothetical protein